jgi:hypothetical protein
MILSFGIIVYVLLPLTDTKFRNYLDCSFRETVLFCDLCDFAGADFRLRSINVFNRKDFHAPRTGLHTA